MLFAKEKIDFNSYEIRYFLSCYMNNKKERQSIRRGKYQKGKDKAKAYKILNNLCQAFAFHEINEDLEKDEIYHELLIPFLEIAHKYKNQGKSFGSYLKASYKFELKRHLDYMLNHRRKKNQLFYYDDVYNEQENFEETCIEKINPSFIVHLDEDLVLNDPQWIQGKTASYPFDQLTIQQRLILAKYYYEGYTDKEIGQLIGRNLKSINRIRKKLECRIRSLIQKGEIKYIKK